MKLTPKQIEALEKIASILPDLHSSIKLTLEDEKFNFLTLEDMELIDRSVGDLLDLCTEYFQFKDRSQEKISPEDLEDPMDCTGAEKVQLSLQRTFQIYTQKQAHVNVFLKVLEITSNNQKVDKPLSEIIATARLYTKKIITELKEDLA